MIESSGIEPEVMRMEAYTGFAAVYDQLMEEIPYEQWCGYITGLLKEYGVEQGLVLELGCGTGTMTELLAEAGYDMIGIDVSEEMLAEAMEKKQESGHAEILYLQQDMREFELYGTVRAAVSVCDSMNYLTEPGELEQVCRLVNNYLDPGGIFIFDMKTAHYFRDVVGNRSFGETYEDCGVIWENDFDEENSLNSYALTIFREERNGLYSREEELHYQKAYSAEEIRQAVEAGGMEFLAAYSGDGRKVADGQSQRIYIVAREQGKRKGSE